MIKEKENGSNLPVVFNYGENKKLKAYIIDDKPAFVSKDVCDILGIQNPRKAIANLDEDEKLTYPIDTSGQKRNMNLVTEGGLYKLIFQSRKPEALIFRKWVTNDVLPALRKYGTYQIPGFDMEHTSIADGIVSIIKEGNQVYDYKQGLEKYEYSISSGSFYKRMQKYQHNFVKENGRYYCTFIIIEMLYHNRKSIKQRKLCKESRLLKNHYQPANQLSLFPEGGSL